MMNISPLNDDNSGSILIDTGIESHKKSFLIRDILESSQNNNHHPNTGGVLLPTNERLISWILQNREQACFEQNPEHDSEPDSLSPILSEMSKYSMFVQKDAGPIGTLSDSWLNLSNQMASIATNPLAFYQHLYYYALQNQLNSIEILNNHTEKHENIETVKSSTIETKDIKNDKKNKNNNSKNHNNSKINRKEKNILANLTPPSLSSSSSSEVEPAITILSSSTTVTTKTTTTTTASSSSSSSSSSGRNRRNRTVFSELQLMGLERRFDSQKYLSTPDRSDLARALGLTQLQVKTWYQNRRMKWKKQVMQNGCPFPPTKPKGRPKKDSIPTYGIEFTNSILCSIFANNNNHSEEQSGTVHVQD